jgi:hypothetical protein
MHRMVTRWQDACEWKQRRGTEAVGAYNRQGYWKSFDSMFLLLHQSFLRKAHIADAASDMFLFIYLLSTVYGFYLLFCHD